MKLTYETQSRGTRLSFVGLAGVTRLSKPFAQGVRAWRQRLMGTSVPVVTQPDHSRIYNCTRVSEVERRHT
jgi:hypothetical protein